MRPLMGQQLVIDPLRFARERGQTQGTVDCADLPRLKESLVFCEGAVCYHLSGGTDSEERPFLRVQVSGNMLLQCQRCLGTLSLQLDSTSTLFVAEQGRAPDRELIDDPSIEWVAAEPELDVPFLVEDEILLALPISPKHEQCNIPCSPGEPARESVFTPVSAVAGPGNPSGD
jgi:uncharacterized protein